MQEIENKILELLSKFRGNVDELNSKSTLQSLNMVSEDIDDFFELYSREFNIVGEGYNYYDYFLEQVHPIHIIRDYYYRLFNFNKLKKMDLTIGHLVKVAEKGKWYNPN